MKRKTYVLLTAAYNEEKKITTTISSVIAQTVRPQKWVIVSDGSTDATDSIIKKFAAKHAFISYVRAPDKHKTDFAAKVNALNYGLAQLAKEQTDFIGILDADIELDKDYYATIIARFNDKPKLGIAGGDIVELVNGQRRKRIKTFNSVAGAVQFFRLECFKETPGFLPLAYGGEDATVEISARMHGWEVRTFPELEVVHHGQVGGGAGSYHRARFRRGIMFFQIGYHPLFHLTRCAYRVIEKPYLTGSIVELCGYIYAKIKFKQSRIPADIVRYLREEQMNRLKKFRVQIK